MAAVPRERVRVGDAEGLRTMSVRLPFVFREREGVNGARRRLRGEGRSGEESRSLNVTPCVNSL